MYFGIYPLAHSQLINNHNIPVRIVLLIALPYLANFFSFHLLIEYSPFVVTFIYLLHV